jgi:hypothetical protein
MHIESDWNRSDEDNESQTTELLSNATNLIGVIHLVNLMLMNGLLVTLNIFQN